MKKIFLLLVLVICAAGGVFAQSDFKTMPKNNVSVDIGPLMAGVGLGLMSGNGGFGFAAQYERQLNEKISVGGRFAYLNYNLAGEYRSEKYETTYNSYSFEVHAIVYPAARVFFLDSMFGFAIFSGERIFDNWYYGSCEASRFLLKIGEKVGWRIDFGKPGGFFFEPSVGLYYALGFGPSVDEQLQDYRSVIDNYDEADAFGQSLLESIIYVGGPRIGLNFGWRF
ncbi:MAG: hypothetical protein LBU82_00560 [Treponema sp.]|jgi:hypothetical protein|nr:hypothetical protein [Treponema sp.]